MLTEWASAEERRDLDRTLATPPEALRRMARAQAEREQAIARSTRRAAGGEPRQPADKPRPTPSQEVRNLMIVMRTGRL